MLAQSFQSAADLGISDLELSALIKVLGMLEREELVHAECPLAKKPRESNEFNMAATLDNSCGTIGCIAGWAYCISGRGAFPEIVEDDISAWRPNRALLDLFGIGKMLGDMLDIKPEQAATALRSYLTTGDAKWAEAFA